MQRSDHGRRIQFAIALGLACVFLCQSDLLNHSGEALAEEGLLLPDAWIAGTDNAAEYRVAAEHKFVRLSPTLRPLQDGPDDVDATSPPSPSDRMRKRLEAAMDKAANRDATDPSDDVDEDRDTLDSMDRDFDDEMSEGDDLGEEDSNWLSKTVGDRSIELENGRFALPPLAAPTTATDMIGNGRVPEGFRAGQQLAPHLLPESGQQRNLGDKPWPWMVRRWEAPNTYSHPRYFEDRMLERHGIEHNQLVQPIASGLRFFATVPALPYLMTLSHPADCESTLGYFRSGSCAPMMHQRPPYSRRAAVVEAAAIATGIIALP